MLAKLKDGVSLTRALDDVTTIGAQLSQEHPRLEQGVANHTDVNPRTDRSEVCALPCGC